MRKKDTLLNYLKLQDDIENFITKLNQESDEQRKSFYLEEIERNIAKCVEERDKIKVIIGRVNNEIHAGILQNRFVNGMSMQKIAEVTGKHERTVKRIISTAIANIDF